MNIVYEEATSYSPVKDSKWVAKQYSGHSKVIADCLTRLDDVRTAIENLHNICKDNCDVGFALGIAVEKLGVALGHCINYQAEYEEEANCEDDTNEKEKGC